MEGKGLMHARCFLWFYCKLLSLYIGVQGVSYAPKESYYAQIIILTFIWLPLCAKLCRH